MFRTWLGIATAAIAWCCFITDANWLVSTATITGIVFVVCVSFGKPLGNLFGALSSICVGFLSYEAGYYGNVVMSGIIAAMTLMAWYMWYFRSYKGSIKPRTLSYRYKIGFISILAIGCIASIAYSYMTGAKLPVLDGVTAVIPIMATLLLMGAYKEQWLLWIPFNVLEVIMWVIAYQSNPELLAVIFMKVIFCLNSVIGYYNWNWGAK